MQKTFILVHGAWHGSWCWKYIVPKLRDLGHKVHTPDLIENQSSFSHIGLKDYVRNLETVVRNSPSNAILVGHSMAGIVISQVAENIPEKIERLIYVAAYIPEYRGSLIDEEQKSTNSIVPLEAKLDKKTATIAIKHSAKIRELFYGNCSDEDFEYAKSNIADHPFRPFTNKVYLSKENFGSIPKTYIECLQDKAISIDDQRRMQSYVKCEVISIDTDHSPFFSAISHLVAAIL